MTNVTPISCGPALTANAHFQILVERGVVVDELLNGEGLHRLAVDEHDHLVRTAPFAQSADVPAQIARKPDLNVVLAIPGERVRDRHAAARAKRKPGDMRLLRPIGRQPNGVGLHRRLRAADREAADFLRSRDVAIQKRWRQIPDGDVVEAVAAFVGRQQRIGVDVERQQISDGVLILGAIETTQGFGAAGVRLRRRRRIERRFQPCQQRAAGRPGDSCGMLGGGMVPVCTLRITFSQTSGLAPGLAMSTLSSIRSAVFTRSLWQVTQ